MSLRRRFLEFLDSILRGVGQVMFQNDRHAGLLFLIGIGYASLPSAAAVLLGTVASTATAMLLGADRALVRAGLFGFNGALVGVALLTFLEPDAVTWGAIVLAAACSTVVMAGMLALLSVWKMPALTAPFVFTTLCFLLATPNFGRLRPTDLLPAPRFPAAWAAEGVVSVSTLAEGLFNGVAQVFLQGNVLTGAIFAAGLLVASRAAFAAALAGSLTGLVVAWGMGAAESALRSGLFGFNSVLTAIALASVFLALDGVSAVFALLASVVAAVVFAAASAALTPFGMPALTLPFVLVTWTFLFASPIFPKLRAAETDDG